MSSAILQYQGNKLINRFESHKEAVKATGVQGACLSNCLNGKRNSAGGYVWKYEDPGSAGGNCKYYYKGQPLSQYLKLNNIPYDPIRQRIKKGMSVEEAVEKPLRKKRHNRTIDQSGLDYSKVRIGKQLKKQRFNHQCPDCMFMGHALDHDMYICCGDHGCLPGVWLIARFGNHEFDYTACRDGLAFGILEKAQELARWL